MNEDFIRGFEKIAINLGTIQRAVNNAAGRIGVDVSGPISKLLERSTYKFIDLSKNHRKIFLNGVSKMQDVKRLGKMQDVKRLSK